MEGEGERRRAWYDGGDYDDDAVVADGPPDPNKDSLRDRAVDCYLGPRRRDDSLIIREKQRIRFGKIDSEI